MLWWNSISSNPRQILWPFELESLLFSSLKADGTFVIFLRTLTVSCLIRRKPHLQALKPTSSMYKPPNPLSANFFHYLFYVFSNHRDQLLQTYLLFICWVFAHSFFPDGCSVLKSCPNTHPAPDKNQQPAMPNSLHGANFDSLTPAIFCTSLSFFRVLMRVTRRSAHPKSPPCSLINILWSLL